MIRSTDPILTLEDWKGREAILTLSNETNTRFQLERVKILEITPFALHCRDERGRAQVYVFGGGVLKAWEEVDERNSAELEHMKKLEEAEITGVLPTVTTGEPVVTRKIITAPIPSKANGKGIIEVKS